MGRSPSAANAWLPPIKLALMGTPLQVEARLRAERNRAGSPQGRARSSSSPARSRSLARRLGDLVANLKRQRERRIDRSTLAPGALGEPGKCLRTGSRLGPEPGGA